GAGQSQGHPLRARVEGGVVADEPEQLYRLLARVLDLELELGRPLAALAPFLAERVARFADRLQRRLQAGVELPLLQQPPPQLVDDRRLLDPDRAGGDAGVALHAGPERLLADTLRADHAAVGAAGTVVRLDAEVEDDVARRERAPGRQRRAGLVAAPALGA